MMTADSVSTWLPVRATLLEWQRISKSFRELLLSFEFDVDSGVQRGDLLWGTPASGVLVALGWRWREVEADVVAIDNPMNISSNVVLLDERGHELSPTKRILHLNNAVYRLRWQSRVVAGAKRRRTALAA
jgi:hypothetical protein